MKSSTMCISAADIHGNKLQYEKLKKIVADNNVSFVFLSGDLLPKDGGSWHPDNKVQTIAMQRKFIEEFFLEYLAELGEIATVYAIFGNDDFIGNYPIIESADIPNVHFLNNQTVKLPVEDLDLYVAGYPYIGLTPFLHKDWEKWDLEPREVNHKIYRSDGYILKDGAHLPVNLEDSEDTIKQDLEELAKSSDPRKTLYVFHEAPYDTPLDMIAPDNKYIKDGQLHVGSKAIRQFVETQQPLLTMHGHIHETFRESGDFRWRSGQNLSITAANDFSSDTLSYVLFSLPDLEKVERLEI